MHIYLNQHELLQISGLRRPLQVERPLCGRALLPRCMSCRSFLGKTTCDCQSERKSRHIGKRQGKRMTRTVSAPQVHDLRGGHCMVRSRHPFVLGYRTATLQISEIGKCGNSKRALRVRSSCRVSCICRVSAPSLSWLAINCAGNMWGALPSMNRSVNSHVPAAVHVLRFPRFWVPEVLTSLGLR